MRIAKIQFYALCMLVYLGQGGPIFQWWAGFNELSKEVSENNNAIAK